MAYPWETLQLSGTILAKNKTYYKVFLSQYLGDSIIDIYNGFTISYYYMMMTIRDASAI